jgi:hypothetical protein
MHDSYGGRYQNAAALGTLFWKRERDPVAARLCQRRKLLLPLEVWRKRAMSAFACGDFCDNRGFESGLESAEEKFAWRFGANIVSRTHCR